MKNQLNLFVNGKEWIFKELIDPRMTLIQFLRKSGLTGTKLGCGEGGCGACTVMLSTYDVLSSEVRHISANACLTPLCSLDGYHVTTVEGIGGIKTGMHPIQQRLASLHGSQCGFCTPGIVMALYTLLRSNPNATPHEIEESLDGNLCRCTGYRPILDAAKSLSNSKSLDGCCGGSGSGFCPCADETSEEKTMTVTDPCYMSSTTEQVVHTLTSLNDDLESLGRCEPIFPPKLMRFLPEELMINNFGVTWYQPIQLESLVQFKHEHPDCRIVVGNTEVGIEVKFKNMSYPVIVNPSHVGELKVLQVEQGGLRVGAAVTLQRLNSFIRRIDPNKDDVATRGMSAISDMLTWFASNHIRNVACIGGNICTASPISDMNPMLCACGAILTLRSVNGSRTLPITEFFLAYRKVDLQSDEILQDVFIPFTKQWEYVVPLKQARRREDDISIVTSGIRVLLKPQDGKWLVDECCMSFGGMAPTTVVAKKSSNMLLGREWSRLSLDEVFETLHNELLLPLSVPGGQAEFRNALTTSFLYRSFIKVCLDLQLSVAESGDASLPPSPSIPAEEVSAADGFITQPKSLSRGEQSYYKRSGGLTTSDHSTDGDASNLRSPVGEPIQHKSANVQVTGEALYTDDIPSPAGTYFAAVVTSTKAHALIIDVNIDKCLDCSGFVQYFSAKDVIGSNETGAIFHDEEVFVTKEAKHVGAVIGLVVATSHDEALFAARQVQVTYQDLPAVISIEDAIQASSFYPNPLNIESGNIVEEEAGSDVVVSGSVNIGGQEHFYLETNCCLVTPTENRQLEVFSSTQCASETQLACAHVCGIPQNHVVSRVKRIGGGFGGKESRTIIFSAPVALAAYILGKPVRMNVDRDVDMQLTGQRHAFVAKYRAGCSTDGKLKFMDLKLYSNAGFSYDLSEPVMGRACLHCDSVYRWPALHVTGTLCRTNQSSHTAFRGFGGPQGVFACETVIEHLATAAKIPVDVVRKLNMYAVDDKTHFNTVLDEVNISDAWALVQDSCNYQKRIDEVEEFNRNNKWKKRGIYLMSMKYGINYTAKFMNQGGCLIHIYRDGSVIASHGGMEMGQGVHTKMTQIVARALNIPHDIVHISETSTATVANASATAGSMTTDLYGMALLNACEQLNERLSPLRSANPGASWQDIVNTAYFSRVNLSALGFYIVPTDRCGYDFRLPTNERKMPFNYFTQGAACSEVEIDCLTGDCKVRRVDIATDIGQSINPALDLGQIEGAFMQGFGWCTIEELIWGDSEHPWVRPGHLFTKGPGTYKIPSFNDVPQDFRVHLMDKTNKRAVHSSKGVGEPPFLLSLSAFFAVRNAIAAAREQNISSTDYFQLNLPVTSERIRMTCCDSFASRTAPNGNGSDFQPKGSW